MGGGYALEAGIDGHPFPASMRPPPVGGGYGPDEPQGRGHLQSFNEAPARGRGILSSCFQALDREAGFNEAPARGRGIPDRRPSRSSALFPASMRPPPVGGGYVLTEFGFQSGAGASMRPPPVGGGYHTRIGRNRPQRERFNEAPARGRGIQANAETARNPWERRFNEAPARGRGIPKTPTKSTG